MTKGNMIKRIGREIQEGMGLVKCKKCGCMRQTLEYMRSFLSSSQTRNSDLLRNIECWPNQMEAIKYTCLGCEHCFPAMARNILNQVFPEAQADLQGCTFEVGEQTWPPVPREYFAFCDGPSCPVAVSAPASVGLAENLASVRPKELCIVGKTETENISIDKVIKNTITNSSIRFLLLAGKDPQGHYSGRTLLALWKNGVDENMRVRDPPVYVQF